MKPVPLILIAVFILAFASLRCAGMRASAAPVPSSPASEFRNGDLIFHTSQSSQSQAVQLATGSKYSHCGIIYQEHGKTLVLEAVQPVKLTPN